MDNKIIHKINNKDGTVDYWIDDKELDKILKPYTNPKPHSINFWETYISSAIKLTIFQKVKLRIYYIWELIKWKINL